MPAAARASPRRSPAAGSSTNEADADHFISDVKKKVGAIINPLPNFPGTKDDADIELPPHDESTIQGGLELRSKAGATGVQTLERNISAALGRTVNTNAGTPDEGDKTYFFEGAFGMIQDTGLGDLEKEKLLLFKLAASGQAQAQARLHRRQERPAEDAARHRPARRDRGRRRLGEPQGLRGQELQHGARPPDQAHGGAERRARRARDPRLQARSDRPGEPRRRRGLHQRRQQRRRARCRG